MNDSVPKIQKKMFDYLRFGRWNQSFLEREYGEFDLELIRHQINDFQKRGILDRIETDRGKNHFFPSILHISDFHMHKSVSNPKGTELLSNSTYFESIKNGYEKIAKSYEPDYCIISGDISDKGKKKEFDIAEKHIEIILSSFKSITLDRLIIVPGNHDLLWGVPDQYKFNNYSDFIRKIWPNNFIEKNMQSVYLDYYRVFPEHKLVFLCFNTSIYISSTRKRDVDLNRDINEWLEKTYNEITEKFGPIRDYRTVIVTHHPLRLLGKPYESLITRLKKYNVVLCLSGHDHTLGYPQVLAFDSDFILPSIGTGCLSKETYHRMVHELGNATPRQINILSFIDKGYRNFSLNNYFDLSGSDWRHYSAVIKSWIPVQGKGKRQSCGVTVKFSKTV